MSKEKSPAFQFYPKDYMADVNVRAMTLEERGAYVDLMCLCWLEESIPDDPKRLARILGITEHRMKKIWGHIRPCFVADGDGSLRHKRLDEEREKQQRYRDRQSEAGKRGAVKRWGTND